MNRRLFLAMILLTPLFLQACSLPYMIKSGYHQLKILRQRSSLDKVLQDPSVDEKTKSRLRLVQEVKKFSENELLLEKSGSYDSFVALNRPYVTYLLRVSPVYELKSYQWNFPFVGKFPYKGYFSKEGAEAEAKKFSKASYDTYIRGVSAYSSLGWFDDPILSSMIEYDEITLVSLVIHEIFHGTIFIKGHTEFNERLANFVSYVGVKMFYTKKEGENSPSVQLIEKHNHDRILFSNFISVEIKNLRSWYREHKENFDLELKEKRLRMIQDNFIKDVKPRLKSSIYDYFPKLKLNNAQLLSYETYMEDLSDFKKAYHQMGEDFPKFLSYLKTLKSSRDPQKALEEFFY